MAMLKTKLLDRIPKLGMSLKKKTTKRCFYKGHVEYPYLLKICPKTNYL